MKQVRSMSAAAPDAQKYCPVESLLPCGIISLCMLQSSTYVWNGRRVLMDMLLRPYVGFLSHERVRFFPKLIAIELYLIAV